MDLLQMMTLLVIAGLCAAIAQWVIGFSPGGFVISMIIGVIGAYLGSSLVLLFPILPSLLPVSLGNTSFDLIWAMLGSLLLLLLLYLLHPHARAQLPFAR